MLALTSGPTAQAESANDLYYYRPTEKISTKRIECDIAIYGGTPAGVAAAAQAGRDGKKVILLSFDNQVGGLTSGGLTCTDIGHPKSIGGIATEFYGRIGKLVDFSPSAAELEFRKILAEANVTIMERCHLESATLNQGKIQSIALLSGESISAKVFIDSSYEGDLLAAANVSYAVGREPANAYSESLAGQWQTVSWKTVYQFCDLPISPYRIANDPASGLLPEISSEPYGKPGEGDYRVQAYNFRMHLSKRADKIPFPKPASYDPDRYALLARFLHADPNIQWKLNYTIRPMTDGPVQMRNGDSNNAGSFSSDYVGGSNRWPDGTYKVETHAQLPAPRRGLQMPMADLYRLRETIFQDHVTYQQGLMHFLSSDPQVPAELRERVGQFGLDPNEFKTTGHWPHALYVREGRRMVSDYIMTQSDCESKRVAEDSVGLASYAMDSHFCQRTVVTIDGKATVRNEGAFGLECPKPYPVSYRSITPRKSECSNLLVPLCLSSSHVAYGSIRMEPVFMILGQSAGMAASMSIDANSAVQDIEYPSLRSKLIAAGQLLSNDDLPKK